MRFRRTSGTLLLVGIAATTTQLFGGCSPKKQTELVPGVSTQVRVPKDLKTVRLDVTVNGSPQFCGIYDVRNGFVRLPRTLALQSQGRGGPVKVTVTGYKFASDDPTAPTSDLQNCDILPTVNAKQQYNPQKPEDGFARVLRASRQPYIDNRILFIPMPLRFSCFEVPCSGDQTCKAGKCVDPDVDSNTLVEYNEALVFGDSNTCFKPSFCMADAVLPEVVDAASCKFALWKTPGAPDAGNVPFVTNGTGLNVRAYYDDGSYSEILDLDKDEGFFVPDPVNAPQVFQLADGLCHPDPQTPHKIVGLTASGLCPSKTALQPVCDEESPSNPQSDASAPEDPATAACAPVEVKPAPSGLVVLMDRTSDMQSFFGADAAKEVLKLSLGDPVFEKTDLWFGFLGRKDGAACTGPFSLEVPQAGTSTVTVTAAQSLVASAIGGQDPNGLPAPPRGFSVGMAKAYGLLEAASATTPYNQTAILILSDGDFSDDCGTSVNLAQLADSKFRGDLGTMAYTVLFGKQNLNRNDLGAANANAIALSGGTKNVFNADAKTGGDPNNAALALNQVTQDLASCVYDAPADGLKGRGVVSYLNPLPPAQQVRIAFAGDKCTANTPLTAGDGAGSGWNLESVPLKAGKQRVRVCGQACTSLRDVLKNTATIALASGQTPPAVPIYVENCSDQAPTPTTDAGLRDATAGTDAAADAGSDAAGDAPSDAPTEGG